MNTRTDTQQEPTGTVSEYLKGIGASATLCAVFVAELWLLYSVYMTVAGRLVTSSLLGGY